MSSDDNWRGTYGVVIYTNKYAGNFEREMCAYCTGYIGECEVGDNKAEEYFEEYGGKKSQYSDSHYHLDTDVFCDAIENVSDDRGCYRPVSIWTDKHCKESYTALIIYFQSKPTNEQLERIKERSKEYSKDIEILDVKVLKRETKTTTEDITNDYK